MKDDIGKLFFCEKNRGKEHKTIIARKETRKDATILSR